MTEQLSLKDCGLYEIPNLSHLPLTKLDLAENRLRFLDTICIPPRLKWLNASQNCLNSDGLLDAPLIELEGLELDSNHIHVLDNTLQLFCPNLKHLTLRKNALEHTEFLQGLSLESLALDETPIRCLDHLPRSLKELSAKNCEIRMTVSRMPPTLETLNLEGNRFRFAGLPLHWGTCLRTLNLSFNSIEKFPRKLPDTLETLILHHNHIQVLPDVLPKSLRVLILHKNKILKIPAYERKIPLRIAILEKNHITDVPQTHSWTQVLLLDENWNTPAHAAACIQIQRLWKRFSLQKRLRSFLRSKHLYDEILQVALHPNHILQTDVFSQQWRH